ncbi:MAG: ABC transporter permease [Oscillospiraceae bacterium]|jgi:ribose/xylose/arabinose/galactoside ABC-type transport system permease subunit|nr:ABC transporter permease [Oscillospiraceae bacterium]
MKKIEISKQLPVAMLVVLIIIGAQLSDSFFRVSNFANIIQYAVESAFIGIGMTFVLIVGGIDLSIGSVLAFASVVSAKMALENVSLPLILLAVIAIGLTCGVVNGLLITKFRIEPFMATLAMMMIMRAATFLFTGGGPLTGTVYDGFKQIIKGKLFGVQNGIWYVAAAFLVAALILNRTRFGRHVYAVGGGEETAKLFGVNAEGVKIAVYMISALLAALSGLLIAARIGIGEPRSGQSYEMTAITICVIGGISMAGGKGGIVGTFVGTMVVCMINNLMNLMNINTDAQPIVTGVMILVTSLIVSREVTSKRRLLVKEI